MPAPKNPVGAKSDKIWRDALMRAVRRLDTDRVPKRGKGEQRLERLADALVIKGISGDIFALKEIGDRLDGRPQQQIGLIKDGDEAIMVSWHVVEEAAMRAIEQDDARCALPAPA